ncbi:MAG: N-acyl homoserine lactonase family protein [Desulfobacterales bacterium]|nr:N-acyl homoserine lactonase family protein [Desulfobacterales bacterium]
MGNIRIYGINTAHIASAGLGATVFYNYTGLTPEYKEKLEHPNYEMMEIRGQKIMGHYSSCPMFYLENAGIKILFDTGLNKQNIMEINEAFKKRDIIQSFWKDPMDDEEKGLSLLNVKPEEIDLVVLSHLHFDHFLNCNKYKNATFLVQSDEIPLAMTSPPYAPFYHQEFSHYFYEISNRVHAIEGDYKITKGVEVWKVGGHSPGLMVMAVETKKGLIVLSSDLFSCFKSIECSWPTGSLWNIKEALSAINRLKNEADFIIPSHDLSFWERYPGGIVG